MINLKNKVTVITGGSRGVGAACAILFARAGSDIVVGYKENDGAAEKVRTGVNGEGRECLMVKGDIAQREACKELVESAVGRFGKIDILVNNVGIWNSLEIGATPEDVFESTLDELLAVNLKSYFFTSHFAVPFFRKQGGGRIINVSSTAGQRGEAWHSHYAASKGGVIALTKSLATELATDKILVNCVAPGWIDNDLTEGVFAEPGFKQAIADGIPLKKIASNEQIAGPILFLASDLASHITGEIINVNGGAVLCG